MVCLGNICRSPLAEGILRHKVEELGLSWTVDSCGTSSTHKGEAPDKRSMDVALKHGIFIGDLEARPFKPEDFDNFDKIYVMDDNNFVDIITQAITPEAGDKVELIMNLVYPNKNYPVPDPYHDDSGFERVFEMLDLACSAIINQLNQTPEI